MSIGAQTAAALVRAGAITVLALIVSGPLSVWLARKPGPSGALAWGLLLAPFFTPPLLISYAFSRFALALLTSSWSQEALYAGVLAVKLIPVAVIVRFLWPPALSAEAWHCYRMSAEVSWWRATGFRLRAAGPGPWIAGGVTFLLAFSDFELASLWSIRSWTVAIFDAQVGGLALAETLRLAAWPLAVELAVLAVIFDAIFRRRQGLAGLLSEGGTRGTPAGRGAWIYLLAAATLGCLLPLAIISTQAAAGLRATMETFALSRELAASALFAAGAAISAFTLAGLARKNAIFALLLAGPGLCGALVVSLFVLALFQFAPLRPAYDTPLPLLLALTIGLLPLALLLAGVRARPATGLHLARQIGSRRLVWELETRRTVTVLGVLFCAAWFEFTASSILAPIGLAPVFVRLHNLAHYGQTAALSAMMLAAFVTPLLVLGIGGLIARFAAVRGDAPFRS